MSEVKEFLNDVQIVIRDERYQDGEQKNALISDFKKYLDHLTEPEAIIIEGGKIKAIKDCVLWYGFEGTDVEKFCTAWRKKFGEIHDNKPANSVNRPFQYEDGLGTKINSRITINRVYSGHEFTDEELDKLFNNEIIEIEVTRNGEPTLVRGKLTQVLWDEHKIKFYRFNEDYTKEVGLYEGTKEITYNPIFGNYEFSIDEKEKLLNGEDVYIIFVNSIGNTSSAKIRLINKEGSNYYYPQANFEIPKYKILGRTLTTEQLKLLDNGQELRLENLVRRDGQTYNAVVRWKDGKYQIKRKDGWQDLK